MLSDVVNQIYTAGAVVALRNLEESQLVPVLDALVAGGIHCVEITMNQQATSLRMITNAVEKYSDRLLVGAGTVMNGDAAQQAIEAGAQFILSPILSQDTMQVCADNNILGIPGVFTPTEIATAIGLGAQVLKVFPGIGPEYIKTLLGPLPNLKLMPMGGVDADNAIEYLQAGAFAVGVGSWLVNAKRVEHGKLSDITMLSRKLMISVANGRIVS